MKNISQQFISFAERECKESSPLYEFLSMKIAEDKELLELCLHSRPGQPIPNLLFGVVHYLLLRGADHPLKEYYPSIVNNPTEFNQAFIPFKSFCQQNEPAIQSLLKSKLVQTNEVRRCAYLYPCFSYIYKLSGKPLALIEIGTSAGLQLLWDKYSYSYQNFGTVMGNVESNVLITAEIKGENSPASPMEIPPVINRYGLDLHINDLMDEEDSQWLQALIWPEHTERRELFTQAVHCFQAFKNEVTLIEGDGVTMLPSLIEQIPQNAIICVFHTHVANQFSSQLKEELVNHIETIGKNRDIFHLYNNMKDRDLHLEYFIDGKHYHDRIGESDGHGKWFTWELKDKAGA